MDGAVRSEYGLTTEGQDLLHLLKRFAASLMHFPNDQPMERQSPGNSDQDRQVAGASPQCFLKLRAISGDDIDIVQLNVSRDMMPQGGVGWNMYMWESSGLGFIVTGGPLCIIYAMMLKYRHRSRHEKTAMG